jgi:hypothetical protein
MPKRKSKEDDHSECEQHSSPHKASSAKVFKIDTAQASNSSSRSKSPIPSSPKSTGLKEMPYVYLTTHAGLHGIDPIPISVRFLC